MPNAPYSLEQQRQEFTSRRLLAGLLAWLTIGPAGLTLKPAAGRLDFIHRHGQHRVPGQWGLARLTGEDFFRKGQPKNTFDTLFFYSVGMSLLVYAVAIPFFQVDYTCPPADGRDSDGG